MLSKCILMPKLFEIYNFPLRMKVMSSILLAQTEAWRSLDVLTGFFDQPALDQWDAPIGCFG